jgi:queuosine precursor transporter
MTRRSLGLLAVAAYIGTVALANHLTARYGFVPVGFGLKATAGTYVIGCAFVFRIFVQDAYGSGRRGRVIMLAAIVTGAALSWVVATPALAWASGVTFLVSESADWAVYTPLRRRGWARAAIFGNGVGAVVDTFLFLWLAGFPILVNAPGQLVGKAYATALYLALGVVARRVLLRNAIDTAGA